MTLALLGCAATPTPVEVSADTRRAYGELLIGAEGCREPGPPALSAADIQRDVDRVERLFRRGYAGFDGLAPRLFEAALAEVRRIEGPIDAPTLRDRLAEAFRFVDDNHVGFWSFEPERVFRATSGHANAYVADMQVPELCSHGLESPQAVRTFEGGELGERWLVQSRGPVEAIHCNGQARALTPVSLAHASGPAFERLEGPYPWLRLRSLTTSNAGALERFVAAAGDVQDASVVIVDLRRTGGGSDRYLRRFFSAFSAAPLRYWQTGRLSSEVMLQGAYNFWSCVRAGGTRDAAGQAWLDARIARAERELDEHMRRRGVYREVVEARSTVAPARTTPFPGKLLVVVDRGCQSACETAVLLARQIPGTIIAGENTGGVMKVGELRWYRLPRSRIWLSLGHRRHDDPTGRFREAYGFAPDIWLTGDDTSADIGRLASCMARGGCEAPPREVPAFESGPNVLPPSP